MSLVLRLFYCFPVFKPMRSTWHFQQLLLRGLQWDADQMNKPLAEVLGFAAGGQLLRLPTAVIAAPPFAFTLPPIGDLSDAEVMEACAWLDRTAKRIHVERPALSHAQLGGAILAALQRAA